MLCVLRNSRCESDHRVTLSERVRSVGIVSLYTLGSAGQHRCMHRIACVAQHASHSMRRIACTVEVEQPDVPLHVAARCSLVCPTAMVVLLGDCAVSSFIIHHPV